MDRRAESALIEASGNGRTAEVAQLLLQDGARVDQQDYLGSSLMKASKNGHTEVIKLLLQNGARVDQQDNIVGSSPLIGASENGHAEVVELLLQNSAKVDLQNSNGLSALMRASMIGHTEIVKLLLEKGAQTELKDDNGWSALTYACVYQHTEVAELLLQNGAQVDVQSRSRWAALMRALIYACKYRRTEAAELLGSPVDLKDCGGWSALMCASVIGHIKLAKLLLQNGAQVDLQDDDGQSALMRASEKGHTEVAKLLLQNGAKVDLQSIDGTTALMRASANGRTKVAKLLLQNGAQIDLQDNKGESALTMTDDPQMADLLQGYGQGDSLSEDEVSTSATSKEDVSDRKITGEDEAEMEQFVQGIEKAVAESGKIDRKLAHMMFVGPPGSGKSSLMDRLLGRLRKRFSVSTGVCDSIVIVDIDIANPSTFHSITIVDPHTWKEIESNASFVGQMVQESITSHPKLESEQSEAQRIAPVDVKSPESSVRLLPTEPAAIPSKSPLSRESIISVIKKHGFETIKKYLKKTCSLYLRDTGGQVEFQEMLALLIYGPSIFVFVFRADLDLKQKFEIEYRKNDGESLNSYTSSITTEEALLQCLASVYAMDTSSEDIVKTHQPLVFIVGTHMDKLGSESEAKIASLNRHLEFIIKRNGFSHLVQYADERKGHVIFAVDNISESEDSFQLIRSRVNSLIVNCGEFSIEYPISYLLFCLDLQNIKKSILTLDECRELAASHGIMGDEVLHLLRFLHLRIGIIRYYDVEGLRHLVILEPQVLFNKTTDLIAITFSSGSLFPGVVTALEKKGILSASAFASLKKCFSDDEISPVVFLQLLVHLRITAPFLVAGDQEERYFIPCVLNHVLESTSEELETDISPLCVKFRCNHCPKGIYGVLVTHLMRPEREDNSTTFTLLEDKIFKDQVSFEVKSLGVLDEITLKLFTSHLETSFLPDLSDDRDTSVGEVCNNVREIIEKSILRSLKDLHYKREKVGPEMCFKCEHCSELHPVTKGKVYHKISCRKSRKTSRIPPNGRCWYNEDNDSNEDSSRSSSVSGPHTTPSKSSTRTESPQASHHERSFSGTGGVTMADHHQVTKFLRELDNDQLIGVGVALGLYRPNLKRMKDLLGDMVAAWLREDDNVTEASGNPSWASLATALEDMGHNGIASKIRK